MKKTEAPLQAKLVLEDGSEYSGWSFGKNKSIAGEVIFNTGMIGIVQAITDPACKGQIFVSTYPMAGNCGAPVKRNGEMHFDEYGLPVSLESEKIQVSGLVVQDLCEKPSHYSAGLSLSSWLEKEKIPGIYGIDTRAIAVRIREKGAMRGKIIVDGKSDVALKAKSPLCPADVSQKEVKTFVKTFSNNDLKVIVLDCGVKANVIRCLLARNAKVIRAPWDHNLEGIDYDGLVIAGGPGDPKKCEKTIETARGAFSTGKPVFGIGLGALIMAVSAGADTYKLPFGHRSQNQPCVETDSNRCFVTSQNHGYSVRDASLPKNWETWFTNANDNTIEGFRCKDKPFSAVLFNPEGCPGSQDTVFLFDRFIAQIKERG